jgi:hypothetical protein
MINRPLDGVDYDRFPLEILDLCGDQLLANVQSDFRWMLSVV